MDAQGLSTTIARAIFAIAFLLTTAHAASAQVPVGQISGTVTDSVHSRPLVGATIIATPATITGDTVFHSALSDNRGRFRLSGLRAGRYALTAEHPYADSTGVGALPLQIDVPAQGVANVALGIPSAATLRRGLCPAAVTDTTLGIVLGTVRRLDRSVVSGASVVLKWSDFDVDHQTAAVQQKEVSAVVMTDSLGVYRACGVPVARTLFMQAQLGTATQTGVLEARVDEAGVLVRDLTLAEAHVVAATTTAVTDPRVERRLFSLPGRVVSANGAPIASAQVRVFGTDQGATTNEAGEFRLNNLPGGTQGVELLALGYMPRRLRVEISGDAQPLTITLEKTTVVLDSIRVTAKRVRNAGRPGYAEFDHRMATGQGRYITEEEIEKRHAFVTSDLFHSIPGVTVSRMDTSGNISILSNRLASINGLCRMQIFIDGVEQSVVDVNLLPPASIHGIEVYSVASAPVKYPIRQCGAILIWTK